MSLMMSLGVCSSSGGVVWRIRVSDTRLVCAAGSRNGTEETKLLVLDFDLDDTMNKTGLTGGCGSDQWGESSVVMMLTDQ